MTWDDRCQNRCENRCGCGSVMSLSPCDNMFEVSVAKILGDQACIEFGSVLLNPKGAVEQCKDTSPCHAQVVVRKWFRKFSGRLKVQTCQLFISESNSMDR